VEHHIGFSVVSGLVPFGDGGRRHLIVAGRHRYPSAGIQHPGHIVGVFSALAPDQILTAANVQGSSAVYPGQVDTPSEPHRVGALSDLLASPLLEYVQLPRDEAVWRIEAALTFEPLRLAAAY
jgi:hypothetical protein